MATLANGLRDVLRELADKVMGWGEGFILMLPNLVAATLILVAAWLLSRVAGRLICRLWAKAGTARTLDNLVYTTVRVLVVVSGGIVALQILDLEKAATTFLAGAGIVGIAIGFAFQDLSANFISGIAMAIRRPMRIGDVVETNGYYGKVEALNLRSTSIRQTDGKLIMLPNRKIFENAVINYSQLGELRVELACGIAYDENLAEVREAVHDAMQGVDHVEDRRTDVLFTEFGNSSIDFVVRFWITYSRPFDLVDAKSAAIMELKRVFDERDITIPFPIRTLDFDVHGGASLEEQLRQAG